MIKSIEAALQAVRYPDTPVGLYEPIAYTLESGGKRIRPHLLLLAYSLYRDDTERAMPAAIGLETYHNHTLLHDDLMDKADMRRGRPTVHRKWNANTAILSGDTMLILAFRHFLDLDDEARRDEALRLFARTAKEICEGQQYDMNFERRDDVTEAEYMEMIRLKTSVLPACAARLGALIAGAPEQDCEALYGFGERMGLAFQLQDDYLDCFGDPAVFGKNNGGDILCGKKTFLLINALARADEQQRAELLRLTSDATQPDAERIDGVLQIYRALGIPQLTQERIDALFAEADACLDAVGLPDERKQPLRDFADALLHRKR